MPARDADVLILGAGAAGLAAAHELARAGVSILVLEARHRTGGRIHTLRERCSPVPIELGAEFVHGRAEATWRIIREAKLIPCDVADNHWQMRGGRLGPMPDFWKRIAPVMNGLGRLRRDLSFAQYLQRRGRSLTLQQKQLAAMFVEGFDAADLDRISAKSLSAEQGQIGEDAAQYRVLGGYDLLLRHLVAGRVQRSLRLGTMVRRLIWRRGAVEAIADRAGRLLARAAVVTLPVSLLQLPDGARGSIAFEPEIDAKRHAAGLLELGPVIKLVLRFDTPFWEQIQRPGRPDGGSLRDMSFLHWHGGSLPTWWTTLPLRTAVLTGWAGGPRARRLCGRGGEVVVDEAIETLSKITRQSARGIRRMLQTWHTHDWQGDAFARGAYSYVRLGGAGARAALARPLQRTLFFAGEATDTAGEAGTVAGALASGLRAARQVLRALQ